MAAPAKTPAGGWAPPMPPSPAVTTKRPAREPPKRAPRGHQGLVGALQDALRADVLPGPGGHPGVRGEALIDQGLERGPDTPGADDVGVGHQHQRREAVRGEQADARARLHHQSLVLLHPRERGHDAIVAVPVARGPGAAGVDDQLLGPLADLQGVLPQAQDGLGASPCSATSRPPHGDGALFPNGHVSLPSSAPVTPCKATVPAGVPCNGADAPDVGNTIDGVPRLSGGRASPLSRRQAGLAQLLSV